MYSAPPCKYFESKISSNKNKHILKMLIFFPFLAFSIKLLQSSKNLSGTKLLLDIIFRIDF